MERCIEREFSSVSSPAATKAEASQVSQSTKAEASQESLEPFGESVRVSIAAVTSNSHRTHPVSAAKHSRLTTGSDKFILAFAFSWGRNNIH
ncbi:hypothetical protein JTB14_032814 [Gonioctena quinquepunctata]|nr:hypothetical protein JTB14_032814 [Gonioctena quinquepunctata]